MVWIPEQKASSFSSDVLEPTFKEEEPFRSTTLTSHVSNWLFRLACLDQRTNAASGRIIPQLQLWASLNSWRNGEGHLRSFRYSYRQGLSTADTSWDHDLKDLSCREKKLPNNLEFPTLKREKKPKNLDHFRQMSIPNKTTNYQHLPKKKNITKNSNQKIRTSKTTPSGSMGAEASGIGVEGNVWIPSTWRNWRSFKHHRVRLLGSFNTRFSHLSKNAKSARKIYTPIWIFRREMNISGLHWRHESDFFLVHRFVISKFID